jgi:3'(2'), 5'-bisphosphate nucleotidase
MTAMAVRAADAIMAVAPAAMAVRHKLDQSPVTAADEIAETLILEGLSRLLPGVPVVSEEAAEHGLPASLPDTFLLVDALDGTKEFIAGRPEFTVNIALVTGGQPAIGVVAAPALHRLWRGIAGDGAERLDLGTAGAPTPIRSRRAPAAGLTATLSRSHRDTETEAFLDRLPVADRTPLGSSAKFCLVAEGSADLYPRLGPICEWDIAAGHAVLVAAGGLVTTPAGEPIRYGGVPRDFRLPGFLAWGDREAARRYAT